MQSPDIIITFEAIYDIILLLLSFIMLHCSKQILLCTYLLHPCRLNLSSQLLCSGNWCTFAFAKV